MHGSRHLRTLDSSRVRGSTSAVRDGMASYIANNPFHTWRTEDGHHHYQFDTFRRAKHSSMMVLHHLRHPDPPALTHSCDNCRQTITSVLRWSCSVCKNYDLCEQCKSHNCDLEHCGQSLTPMHNLVERVAEAESEG